MMNRGDSDLGRGQALVEFALILPILVLLLVGLFDVGRAVFAYNTVANAAREAARLAVVDQTVLTISGLAAQRGVSLGLDPSSDVAVDFLTSALADAAPCNGSPVPPGCIAEVTVSYAYTPATPIIGNFIGSLTLSSTARMPVERSNP